MKSSDPSKKMTRRSFLIRLLGASTLAAVSPGLLSVASKEKIETSLKDPWLTIKKVQEHLLPSEPDSVGAKEVNALQYLRDNVMDAPRIDLEEKSFIKKGVRIINEDSFERYEEYFVYLTNQQRENILQGMSKSHFGERWLSVLLTYIFEALLGDPVYGGNPDEIGWKYLEHQPGYPLPSEDKRYQEVLKI
ncbi:MAG: gluconate 2-dehydrogenase gamma chain [Halioglobus sp.]|jgi:gluconate 2-dehydrogenase gamma chain